MPTRAKGAAQMDRDVEDGWLLLDSDIAGYQEQLESNDDIDLTTA